CPRSMSSSSISMATAPSEISTLSLHDALPIYKITLRVYERALQIQQERRAVVIAQSRILLRTFHDDAFQTVWNIRHIMKCTQKKDRKSTRLNSSHVSISYAVFCLKKKKKRKNA